MSYEDMLHEQENQTWFTIEDEMSACDITLRIDNSKDWPDIIFIDPDGDPPVAISPGDALNILKWLEHHQERLQEAHIRRLSERLHITLDEARAVYSH